MPFDIFKSRVKRPSGIESKPVAREFGVYLCPSTMHRRKKRGYCPISSAGHKPHRRVVNTLWSYFITSQKYSAPLMLHCIYTTVFRWVWPYLVHGKPQKYLPSLYGSFQNAPGSIQLCSSCALKGRAFITNPPKQFSYYLLVTLGDRQLTVKKGNS